MSLATHAGAVDGALPQRPLLRGALHTVAAAAAIAGGVYLLLIAESTRGYVSAAIFAASLVLMYGTSATYHRVRWRPPSRAVMKRLDHSMIFVLIGGTYTPFCLIVLNNAWGISMLSIIWGVAAAGIFLKIVWPGVPRHLSVALYVTLGWLAVAPAAELAAQLSDSAVALLIAGGALYTIGGVAYALRKPDPWPRVFGYHEVFHLFVVAGSGAHYLVVATDVLPG